MHMNGGYTAGDRLSAGFTTARLETAGAMISPMQGYRFQVFRDNRCGRLYHALAIGREAAPADVRGHALSCGCFLPEEAPGEPLGARRPILHN
jgi:hypothetical protein